MENLTLKWKWRIAKRTPLKTSMTKSKFYKALPWDQVAWIRMHPPLFLEHYQALPKEVLYAKVKYKMSRTSRLKKAELAEICAYLML